MGAISAILGEEGDPELGERLQRMLDRSRYRGEPERHVEGGLAIGIQSMGWDASLHSAGNWLVAFHGYIGNWEELAPAHGLRFPEGAPDAHRLAIAFEALGDDLFAKLRGEWAVVIWNRQERAMFAARDVVGCRPMFWQAVDGRSYLASEVRQVIAGSGAPVEIDFETFQRFLCCDTNRDRSSVLGVCQIPAGEMSVFDSDQEGPRSKPFYRFGTEWPELSSVGLRSAAEIVRDRIETAVRRSSADQPMGVALSGGLDSSTVWGFAHRIESEKTGRPDIAALRLRYPGRDDDEGVYMDAVLAHRPGTKIDIQMRAPMVMPCLEEAAARADTPFLGNIIAQLELARAAASAGRKIMLTGHGGDYAFQGDTRDLEKAALRGRDLTAAWWAARLAIRYRRIGGASRRLVKRLFPRYRKFDPPDERGAERMASDGRSAEARSLWGGAEGALDEAGRRRMLEGLTIERAGWHNTPFEQVCAAFGVDVRHPLFDLDLLEAALSIPQKLHLAGGFFKGLLRIAAASELPEKVCSRRGNMVLDGFLHKGLTVSARDQSRVEGSETLEARLREIANGFETEMVFPLQLLMTDLERR